MGKIGEEWSARIEIDLITLYAYIKFSKKIVKLLFS